MARKRQKQIQNLKIEAIGGEGRGFGRQDDGRIVFVDYAIPGDVVNAFTYKSKRDFALAKIDDLLEPSALRIEPFCEHFYTCGGCRWQHVSYTNQLKFKQDTVEQAFERIGKLDVVIDPIVAADNTQFYRNKLEFTFSNNRWLTTEQINSGDDFDKEHALGFHVPRFFDKIVDVQTCYLQDERSNGIRNALREFSIGHNLSFYDIRKNEGLLRSLIIRNTSLDEWMVIVCFGAIQKANIELVLDFLRQKFSFITSLNYVINLKQNDSIFDQEVVNYSGNKFIKEQIGDCFFKIGPKSFFQTNSEQCVKLYELTADFAQLTGNELVYDLFTGTGTIANYIAKQAKSVVGIELVPEAIEDARANAELNGNENCHFISGKVEDLFNYYVLAQYGKPDVIILDPPRAGIHKNVVEQLLKLKVSRIVYVSCNAATQARDVALLGDAYNVVKIQPIDLFPHTYHVEAVALLELDDQFKVEW